MKAYYLAPTNEEFERISYGNDPRVLGPSVGGASRTKNVQVEYKNDPTVRRGGQSTQGGAMAASATSVQYRGGAAARAAKTLGESMQATGERMQQRDTTKPRSVVVEQYQNAGQRIARTGRSKQRAGKRVQGRSSVTAVVKGSVRTAKTAAVTVGIWSWAFFIWLWVQVPIAIFSLIFMGLHQVFFSVFNSATPHGEDDGFFVAIGNTFVTAVKTVLEGVTKFFLGLFNIDPNIVGGLFMMTHMIVMVIGWLTLFTAAFIYKGTLTNPLFGNGGGTKAMTFLLAMVCYAIPFMNIFPWFFIWTLAVMKNPK